MTSGISGATAPIVEWGDPLSKTMPSNGEGTTEETPSTPNPIDVSPPVINNTTPGNTAPEAPSQGTPELPTEETPSTPDPIDVSPPVINNTAPGNTAPEAPSQGTPELPSTPVEAPGSGSPAPVGPDAPPSEAVPSDRQP
jgi:hypothetical protein